MPHLRIYWSAILCCAFIVSLASCRKRALTPEEILQNGTWIIHNVNDLQSRYGTSESSSIKNAHMQFDANGNFIGQVGTQISTGKWSLNEEKTHIHLIGDSIYANGLNFNDSLQFHFPNERTLVIKNKGYNMEFRK